MVLPEVMYGCDSWTIKKAEHWKIDAFELLRLRKLLRVLWTARRSNQSILEEISPEYSLEGLMLKLKLLYFGHLMQRTYSLLKTLMLGKIEDRRRRGWQRMKWLDGIAAATAKSLQLCLTPCDPMECSMPGFPVLHHLLELAQPRVHWISDAIQPFHPLSSPPLPAFNTSQHQGLF